MRVEISKLWSWPRGLLRIVAIVLALCAMISTAASSKVYAGEGMMYFTGVTTLVWTTFGLLVIVMSWEERLHVCSAFGHHPYLLFEILAAAACCLFYLVCFILAIVGVTRAAANGVASAFCIAAAPLWGYLAYISWDRWEEQKRKGRATNIPTDDH